MAVRRGSLAALLAVGVIALASAVPAGAATTRTLDPTPPMGFNDWNAYGCNVSAQLIEQSALYIHTSGMQKAGYKYVNIDDCWQLPQRNAEGRLVADPAKFPQGIPAVVSYVHKLGLKIGIYEDAGLETCGGYPGSYGHVTTDAQTFAAWKIDYLKYDQCNIPFTRFPGATHQQVDTALYTSMSRALKATHRKILFSMCSGPDDTSYPWLWGAKVAGLWRSTGDVSDNFPSTVANFVLNARLWKYAHAGAFNDPDMLEIGNGGQTVDEYRAQFSLWSEMAAPLLAGTNLTALSKADLAIYLNKRVIAVDQDELARQGHPIATGDGTWVMTKPLSGGDVSVLMFNSTDQPLTMRTSARAAGAAHSGAYRLQDLWTGTVTRTDGPITGFVPARGVAMFRVHPVSSAGSGQPLRPHTSLAVTTSPVSTGPGGSVAATVSLTDDAPAALSGAAVSVRAPAGWTASPATVSLGRVGAGATVTRAVTLTAPQDSPPISQPAVHATATYAAATPAGADPRSLHSAARATAPLSLIRPLRAPLTSADTTGQGVTAAESETGGSFAIQSAGTGITPQSTSSRGTRAASDSYGAITDPGAAGPSSTVQVTVTDQTGSTLRPYGTAGLIERPSLSVPGTPEGVVLGVSTAGAVTLSWSAAGGTVVDTAKPALTPITGPVTLRLVRTGSTVTGEYSADGGATFAPVGTARLPAADASASLDAGMFHASGVSGWDTEADFAGFGVS